jgi:hypothetical protein
MVPEPVTSLRVCHRAQLVYSTENASEARAIADLLNGPPPESSTQSCQPDGSTGVDLYEFDFGYEVGPDVWVRVSPDCHPAIDNNSLASDSLATAQQALRGAGVN